jgi:hypothetical protein
MSFSFKTQRKIIFSFELQRKTCFSFAVRPTFRNFAQNSIKLFLK